MPRKPSPRSVYAELREKLAAAKAHLAHVERMVQHHRVTTIYIKPTKVRAHTRHGYWRIHYPNLLTK